MKATKELHDLGQSLWLDNITRDLLDTGTLKRYIDELSVTGLTSNAGRPLFSGYRSGSDPCTHIRYPYSSGMPNTIIRLVRRSAENRWFSLRRCTAMRCADTGVFASGLVPADSTEWP
jgi:hypothetical protein